MDVPAGRPEGEPGPGAVGLRLAEQLGAHLVHVVHLDQRDDAGAVAAAELEASVAGAEQLNLVAVPGGQFHGVPLIEGHLQTRVSPKNRTAAEQSRAGMPSQTRPFTLMTSRFTRAARQAACLARIPDLPGAVTIASRRDAGLSLLTGKP